MGNLGKEYCPLHHGYNFRVYRTSQKLPRADEIAILHYTTPIKPWHKISEQHINKWVKEDRATMVVFRSLWQRFAGSIENVETYYAGIAVNEADYLREMLSLCSAIHLQALTTADTRPI